MENATSGFAGFACPKETFQEEVFNRLAAAYAHTICSKFVQRCGESLRLQNPSLTCFIEDWLNGSATSADAWNPVLGEVRYAMAGANHGDYVSAAVKLALHLQYGGQIGSWNVALPSPTRILWGRWLLPVADQLVVASQEHQVFIDITYLGVTKRLAFQRYDGVWEGEGVEALPHIRNGTQTTTLVSRNAFTDVLHFDNIRHALADNIPVKRTLIMCESAQGILCDYAETYLNWVARVVRAIVPLKKTEDDVFTSSSCYKHPGVIFISFPSPSLMISEMLVHEAAHQYFFLLSRLGDVEDGTDTRLYYSPIKQMGRPIKYILLAYHAVANMILFYRLCRKSNCPESKDACKREEILLPQLLELESALRTTRALTPLGKAIWKPLVEHIHK